MDNYAILKGYTPLELMLAWNHYCDAHGREADCILLNEERTYTEAFDDEKQAMKESRTVPLRRYWPTESSDRFLFPEEGPGRLSGCPPDL